jgi:hypothetical protein
MEDKPSISVEVIEVNVNSLFNNEMHECEAFWCQTIGS